MKHVFKLIGIIALVAVIGFSFASCDDGNDEDNGNGGGSSGNTSTTVTINGYHVVLNPIPGYFAGDSFYSYIFTNYSSSQVSVTINGDTSTIRPYAPLTGFYDDASFSLSTATARVTYSPANKVRHEGSGQSIRFYDK
jgi:hypothetical protein